MSIALRVRQLNDGEVLTGHPEHGSTILSTEAAREARLNALAYKKHPLVERREARIAEEKEAAMDLSRRAKELGNARLRFGAAYHRYNNTK